MFRKFFSYLALGFAISAADLRPKATVTAPVASVSFSSANFVQVTSAVNDAKATTIKLPITITQGNALVVMVTWDSNVTATLTDKLGNAFTKNQTDYSGTIAQGQATFSSIGIKGGLDTLTATFGNSRPFRRIVALEYTGVTGVDSSAKAQSTVNPISVPIATKKIGDVLVCAVEPSTDSVTIPTFNKRRITSSEFQVFDTVSNSIGSYPCAGTIKTNQAWTGQVIALVTKTASGNDTQNVKVKWRSSHVNLPDSVQGYWVTINRNGAPFYYQTSCGPGCTTGIPSNYWVQAFPTDTIDSVVLSKVPPPDSGKTADYHISITATSNIVLGGRCCVASKTEWFLYRRTNTTKAQVPLDSVILRVRMVVPPSFGIFGDSFKMYSKAYTDTNSVNPAAIKYIGTLFPRNTTVTVTQFRTNRYSYYLTPFLFGQLVDTIYLGTVEIPNFND